MDERDRARLPKSRAQVSASIAPAIARDQHKDYGHDRGCSSWESLRRELGTHFRHGRRGRARRAHVRLGHRRNLRRLAIHRRRLSRLGCRQGMDRQQHDVRRGCRRHRRRRAFLPAWPQDVADYRRRAVRREFPIVRRRLVDRVPHRRPRDSRRSDRHRDLHRPALYFRDRASG